ncbi:hypothetical protein Bca4012_063282 [Brassica carinata]
MKHSSNRKGQSLSSAKSMKLNNEVLSQPETKKKTRRRLIVMAAPVFPTKCSSAIDELDLVHEEDESEDQTQTRFTNRAFPKRGRTFDRRK